MRAVKATIPEKRTDRNHRLQPGRHDHPADLLPLTLTILIQGQHSDAEIRAAVWDRSLFDNGAALVGVAEPPRGQLGQGTLYTDTTVAPILSGAATRLLVNLFEDSFRLHQRYRQCTGAVQSCSPNLWGMGGSDRQELLGQCDSLRVFAGRPVEVSQQPYTAEG